MAKIGGVTNLITTDSIFEVIIEKEISEKSF